MRGVKAKVLRKRVFNLVAGGLLKRTTYILDSAGTIRCRGARQYYQQSKHK